ncbi:hypothetical protein L916_09930 [Phytophthora nicotianae]|uniref:Uncharacterized protein n=1 Tax=Phytophthora nicotianae TaxID=4792 RepID=W2IY96_PHYNI|nr:hypothetical protein L916_09930 [Phytophthora nicotianae]
MHVAVLQQHRHSHNEYLDGDPGDALVPFRTTSMEQHTRDINTLHQNKFTPIVAMVKVFTVDSVLEGDRRPLSLKMPYSKLHDRKLRVTAVT